MEDSRRGRDDYNYDPTNTSMTRAKECFRNAIRELQNQRKNRNKQGVNVDEDELAYETQLETELLINYGNSLNELARILEALDRYSEALDLDSLHPMAWGRLGETLFDLCRFVHNHDILKDAIHALHQSLADNRLEDYGYGHYRDNILKVLLEAQNAMDEMGIGNNPPPNHEHCKPEILIDYHRDFVEFCTERRLFVNFSLRERPSPHPYEDKFEFSIATPINSPQTFKRLSRILNEAIERFSIARLLLFEAHQSPYKTEFYGQITRFINLNDAAVYGVRAAKLKLAFEAAYNVLDKIAHFINDYFGLGTDKKDVNFDRIWWENPKKNNSPLHPKILDGQNNFLFALYALSREFGKSSVGEENEWAPYKQTRHVLTHRYFVLHAFEWNWQITDGDEYHREWNVMVEETSSLVYLARNALLYLMMAVQLEEARQTTCERESKSYKKPYKLHPPDSGLV